MVLRKPYAFLIKHFRLIHIIIFSFMAFILYKIISIRSFIDSYIASGQRLKTLDNLTNEYTGILFILSVFLVIILSSVILYLLKHKQKPYKFYIVMVISNAVLFFFLLYTRSFLYDLSFITPDLRFTRIIRDIYTIEMFIQIVITIFVFVRAIGFDIKRFDFKKDLVDFNLSNEDNAEFEFEIDLDKNDILARVRRFKRNFKSYYRENKVVFLVVGMIILIAPVVAIVRGLTSREKIYKENDSFNAGTFTISVLNSYKTTVDYHNDEISDNKYYVILKLRYKNNSNNNYQINTDYARLNYDEYNSTTMTTNFYDKFSEYGVPYYSQILHGNETRDFVFVYELDKEFYDNDLFLKYLYDIKYVNKEVKYYYHTIKLNPVVYNNDTVLVDTKSLGEVLSFKDSLLGDSKITINNFDIADRFEYGVLRCTSSCSKSINYLNANSSSNQIYTLTLARVNYNLEYDKLFGEYTIDKFFEKYASIRYVINGKEHINKAAVKDVSPYTSNNYVFIEVSNYLKRAEKIYLDFTIKDKKYTYVVKDSVKDNENLDIPLE